MGHLLSVSLLRLSGSEASPGRCGLQMCVRESAEVKAEGFLPPAM